MLLDRVSDFGKTARKALDSVKFFHQSFLSRNVYFRAIGRGVINGRSQLTSQRQFDSVRKRSQCIASSIVGVSLGSGMSGERSASFIN